MTDANMDAMLERLFAGAAPEPEARELTAEEQIEIINVAMAALDSVDEDQKLNYGDIVEDVLGELSPFSIALQPMVFLCYIEDPVSAREMIACDPQALHAHQGSTMVDCVVGVIRQRPTEEGMKPTFVTYNYDSGLLALRGK